MGLNLVKKRSDPRKSLEITGFEMGSSPSAPAKNRQVSTEACRFYFFTLHSSLLESNENFYKIAREYDILNYAYNDNYFAKDNPPEHERVCSKAHDSYIEAIAAAIYLDGGWDAVTEWFENWLFPKLEDKR